LALRWKGGEAGWRIAPVAHPFIGNIEFNELVSIR